MVTTHRLDGRKSAALRAPAWFGWRSRRVTDTKDSNIRQRRDSVVNSTAKAAVHRLKQGRSAVVRIEAAWAGVQFLAALAALGAAVGLVVWARRRRNRGGHAQLLAGAAPPPAEATVPEPAASANPAAANGRAN
jgi:hypothetical protein